MYYGQISKLSEDKKILSKKDLDEIIEDLVKKKLTNDVTDKNYNPKVAKLVDSIEDSNLSDEQLDELKKAIEAKKNKPKNKNI
jgi:predicted transcriptional regulator